MFRHDKQPVSYTGEMRQVCEKGDGCGSGVRFKKKQKVRKDLKQHRSFRGANFQAKSMLQHDFDK